MRNCRFATGRLFEESAGCGHRTHRTRSYKDVEGHGMFGNSAVSCGAINSKFCRTSCLLLTTCHLPHIKALIIILDDSVRPVGISKQHCAAPPQIHLTMSVAASAMLVPWGNTPRQQSCRPNTLVLLDGCWPATNGLLSPSEGWNEHPPDRGENWGGWGTGHFTPGADLTSKRKLGLVEAASLRSANYCCQRLCRITLCLVRYLLLVRRNELLWTQQRRVPVYVWFVLRP